MSQHPGSLWLDENWSALVEQHNNQWVAASSDGVVASDRSLERVAAQVRRRNIDQQVVVFAFLTFETIQ